MKYIVFTLLGLLIVAVIAISLYLTPNDLAPCEAPESSGKCAPVDAIVAVSGGDTNARADEAIRLYKDGWAPKVIFSGAAADPSGPSNATAMARRAEQAGVARSSIIVEELSRTTSENAKNTSAFISAHEIERIILVTSAYHQRRASLEFHSTLGPTVTILNHPVPVDRQWVGFWWWATLRGWWLAGGELVKIVAFYASEGIARL